MSELTDERKRDTETLAEFMGWECIENTTLEIRKPEHDYWEGWWPFDRHDDAQLLIDECERRGLGLKLVAALLGTQCVDVRRSCVWDALLATPKQKTLTVLKVVEQLQRKDGD